MAKLSMAQMQERLEAAEARAEAAEKKAAAAERVRFGAGLWPNTKRERVEQPPWQGITRFVVPAGFNEGDHIWIDLSLYDYDEETSPIKYKKNPPDFNFSMSKTDKEYATIKEEERTAYLKQKAAEQR